MGLSVLRLGRQLSLIVGRQDLIVGRQDLAYHPKWIRKMKQKLKI
jgi:hypothetical protein